MAKEILLVDDEKIALKITKKMLTNRGHDVEIVTNSSDAIAKLSSKEYDLLILDITMPALNGFDLMHLLKSFRIELPVIFLSNNDNAWTIKEAKNLGGARFVSKKNQFEELPGIVEEIFTQSK